MRIDESIVYENEFSAFPPIANRPLGNVFLGQWAQAANGAAYLQVADEQADVDFSSLPR